MSQYCLAFNVNCKMEIVKRGVTYSKAGFSGQQVEVLKRNRFSECPATPAMRCGMDAKLVHISEKKFHESWKSAEEGVLAF